MSQLDLFAAARPVAPDLLARLEVAVRASCEVRLVQMADGHIDVELVDEDYTPTIGAGATLEAAIEAALKEISP